MHIVPTILCGGSGSRLWPVSRESHPKPFIRLLDGQSLLQKAFLRGAALTGVTEILTVTNRDFFFKSRDEFREVDTHNIAQSFILEPFQRNTAAAVAAAALHLQKIYGDNVVMLVLTADHLVTDGKAFQESVNKAVELAQQHKLVTFGIKPLGPETGYGYIEADGNKVLRFVEKPSLEKAKNYVASGYLWNSGMFCFTAGTILKAMQEHCPAILEATRKCYEQSLNDSFNTDSKLELEPAGFELVEELSIDYAVMEKSPDVAVVHCTFGWSDIGSWNAFGDLTTPDAKGNRIEGEAILHDVENCYIQSKQRLVAAVGVSGLIVIDTPDALLLADKSRAHDVKHIYSQLKLQGHVTHNIHCTVHRPWGKYTVLEEGSNFKIKRIEVMPGASLSLQMHHHRSEHWVVVSGQAKVTNGDKTFLLNSNESTYIMAGHKHRLENPSVFNLVLIEIQSGDYLGEDDIVRFDDIYDCCR